MGPQTKNQMKNPAEQFQKAIADAVMAAANNGVHPAIVHTVLVGISQDVLYSIKRGAQMAAQAADGKTAETILKARPPGEEPANG
jgi:hypothetical protein